MITRLIWLLMRAWERCLGRFRGVIWMAMQTLCEFLKKIRIGRLRKMSWDLTKEISDTEVNTYIQETKTIK